MLDGFHSMKKRNSRLGILLSLAFVWAPTRVFAEVGAAEQARARFEVLVERIASAKSLDALFDGSALRPASASPEASASAVWDYQRLRQAKDLLSNGASIPGRPLYPFTFNLEGGGSITAQSAGLEGFVYALREIERTKGRGALAHHLDDYFNYLDSLLSPVPWAADARGRIAGIRDSALSKDEKYARLIEFTEAYTDSLRRELGRQNGSGWIKQARIYEIFPRAFNLAGKRRAEGRAMDAGFFADFGERDLAGIKKQGFDTIWIMGIFPIGERNRWGTGGGSPYSVRDHEAVNPELGTEEEFRQFVRRAHSSGMKIILDFIPNHTSMDSKLLAEDPAYFIHREADPARPRSPPYGSFDYDSNGKTYWVSHGGYDNNGSKDYWVDTAQVDYSNPAMRRRMAGIVQGWVRRFGVDGFRVDMAYQVLNVYFSRNWGVRMPQREFLEEMITEVRSEYPGTGFIAEAYDGWDALSSCGFDLIYGKNNVDRPGGHHGWYDALQSRDPGWIREAVRRAAFLRWQKGGSDTMDFVGNHDEASPKRAFGPWEQGAAYLTLMMPGATLFYGSQEIGFDKPNIEKEPKSLPFSVPVKVDWASPDPGTKAFYQKTFEESRSLHASLGESDIEALDGASQGWAGYALVSRAGGRKAVVLANPSDRGVRVDVYRPDLGVEYHGELPPFGHNLIRY